MWVLTIAWLIVLWYDNGFHSDTFVIGLPYIATVSILTLLSLVYPYIAIASMVTLLSLVYP